MPLVPTAELVAAAQRRGRGVAAFNVITLEHAEAIVAAAETERTAVILQVSENAVRFHGGRLHPLARAAAAVAEIAGAEVALHLDHVTDQLLLHRAAEAGFSSVMFDASRLPFEENTAVTRAAAQWAHRNGLWLEAELGEVGGKDGAHAPGVRTDPLDAARYTEQTGVDALAVAVGSSHAMTEQTARLDQELIARLRGSVPVPLVLHGSSGVPEPELAAAVANGITKVNIGTALNVAFTGALRTHLAAHPDQVDPRPYLTAGRSAMAEVAARLLRTVAGN